MAIEYPFIELIFQLACLIAALWIPAALVYFMVPRRSNKRAFGHRMPNKSMGNDKQ